MPHPQCPALGIPQRPLQALLLAPLKPSYGALWVRPREAEPGRLGGLAKISVLGQMGGQGGHEPGRLASLPTVSVSVVCPSLPQPSLLSRLSSVPSLLALSRQALARLVPSSLPAVLRSHHSPAAGGVGRGSSPPSPGHAGPYLPLLRGLGACAGGPSLTHWSLVSVYLQRTHSRPTTQSFKSTRPPPRRAQPPPPEASAEPVRSALPARCRAWPRATQRPALPRVSAAASWAYPPCTLPSVLVGGLHYTLGTVGSVWRQLGRALLTRGG